VPDPEPLRTLDDQRPRTFLTIKTGGPLDGLVTIAAADGPDKLAVKAAWKRDNDPRTTSRTLTGYDSARTLAHKWADQLAAGREPEPATDAA
jgi:hypothetical protein